MMIFTSGTSGDPKAVRFAHAMAVMCGQNATMYPAADRERGQVAHLYLHTQGARTMVMGYDVWHPGAQSARVKLQEMLQDTKKAEDVPSVVGVR